MGTVKYSTPYYIMITYISIIPEDVLPGDSEAIYILRPLKPFLSRVILTQEEEEELEDDNDKEELAWGREQTQAFLLT